MRNDRYFGTVYIPKTTKCFESAWLVVNSDEIYIETGLDKRGLIEDWPILFGIFTGYGNVTFINCSI